MGERVDQSSEPSLQSLTLFAALVADPVGKLCDYDCARVTAVFLPLEPRNDACMPILLGRLAQYVRVKQPAHSLRCFGS